MDIGELTIESFAGREGQAFDDTEGGFELRLESVEDLSAKVGPVPDGQRTPFSLLFKGPAEPVLSQGIRPLAHDDLGTLEIFVVPIGREADGIAYQAVFT